MSRLLRNSDHRRMPWKNGGGETVEVIVHPEGASLSDFGWRVSMASVASDGPFSVFPDIDRTLELEPRHFGALSGLGLSNLKLGRDEAAADAFRRLLSIDPLYPNAKRNLKMAQDALARNSI